MPDFAIIPELPAGHPIDNKRSVARIVSVQSVIISAVPAVTIPVEETGMYSHGAVMDVPHVRPSDTYNANMASPLVSVQATETASAEIRRR